ncbi:MAG: ABC transporter ATP-binding protein [Clostridiales bacterium]|nr:ABC transporter ATP-binding protein [Clostridiales bacterium]
MIKRLSQCIREYKKDAILSPLYVLVESLLDVAIPFVMAGLIDKGIEAGNMSMILRYGAILVGFALVALTFGALSGRSCARTTAGFARNLRHDMFHHLQVYSFSNIDKFSSAGLVTRLTTDVSNVQNAFMMIIRTLIRCPAMLIFAMVMSFRINHDISLIFLAVIPILGVGLYLIIKHVHPVFERVFKTYDRLNGVVQENLSGIRVVKNFVREDHEIEKFDTISGTIYKDFSLAERILALNSPLMQGCVYACMILVSWLGAKQIVIGNMSTGNLMSFFTYIMQILSSLMMLSMVFVMITMSRASAERIVEVLDEESDITNCDNPVYEVKDGSVEFTDVSFSYAKRPDKTVLDDIDLIIPSGQTVGIIGGTGSSKSSLVQLIPRLYDVTGGCVKVGGIDVRNYDLQTLRHNVAMVLQKNTLFSGTIKENLRWGNPDATDEELVHACRLAQADDFIRTFPDGYDTYIEQGGTNVSGGQKQRLCIARAILRKPKILILDDSTSAVDTKTDALIRQAFREEIPNTTKIIIAQRISSVMDADQIVVMDNGRINACGTHEELLANNEIYREVYESQQKGGLEE